MQFNFQNCRHFRSTHTLAHESIRLISFNKLAGRVAQLNMRLVHEFWRDFQQTGISAQRLGDILNAPT
ncbi:MAG: hypothetical protein Q7V00_04935 [Sulfurimicrobium sp.]|nr:hypothetical protein [Sulfurimicrobium sp.]MDP2197514.1 hypothetical protein [Sulfurimicrobium sp.]MDP3689084.1 hypothetical protein [Sulfurimicrobium sp.]